MIKFPKNVQSRLAYVHSLARGSELWRAGLPLMEALRRSRVQAEAGSCTLAVGKGPEAGPSHHTA